MGRTKKQSNARPIVWQILVEEKVRSFEACVRIPQYLHDSNEGEGALTRPFVEFEETFSQTSHKGAHLFCLLIGNNTANNYDHSQNRVNICGNKIFVSKSFGHLRRCKCKSNHPNPGNLLYLKNKNGKYKDDSMLGRSPPYSSYTLYIREQSSCLRSDK